MLAGGVKAFVSFNGAIKPLASSQPDQEVLATTQAVAPNRATTVPTRNGRAGTAAAVDDLSLLT